MFPITRLNEKPLLKHRLRLEASRGRRLYSCHLLSQKSWMPQPFLLLLNWIWKIIICLLNILQVFKCKMDLGGKVGAGEGLDTFLLICDLVSIAQFKSNLNVLAKLENENVFLFLEPRHTCICFSMMQMCLAPKFLHAHG